MARNLVEAIVQRTVSEIRFVGNTIKEATIHPLSTSYIDKNTGKVIGREPRKKLKQDRK